MESIHRPSTSGTTSGITSRPWTATSWIRRLWPRPPGRTFRLARRGSANQPDRAGERSSERSREPGPPAARLGGRGTRRRSGTETCRSPRTRRTARLLQFLRALSRLRKSGLRAASGAADPPLAGVRLPFRPCPTTPPRPTQDWRVLVAVFWTVSMVGGTRRQPDLRVHPGLPARDGRRADRSPGLRGIVQLADLHGRGAPRAALGRVGRQVQPQGRHRP